MLENRKGFTLLDLVCWISFGSVLFALVLHPLYVSWVTEDKANVVISVAVHEAKQAAIKQRRQTGSWPTTKEEVAAVINVMRVQFENPYEQGQPLDFILGRPKNQYDVIAGSIRFIPEEDSLIICGYGSKGRLIKEAICPPL